MIINFIKDITNPEDDGYSFRYRVDDNNLVIQISRTVLGMWGIIADNAEELLEQINFEPLITDVINIFSENKKNVETIIIESNGCKVNGKIIYTNDDTKNLILNTMETIERKNLNGFTYKILYFPGDEKYIITKQNDKIAKEATTAIKSETIAEFDNESKAKEYLKNLK